MQLAARLESQYTSTIEALVSALEARDPYTQAHTSRIRDLSGALADAMQVTNETRQAVRLGSILHDVGKIGIPDEVLRKDGPLTEDEWAMMRTHPAIGKRMLEGIDFLKAALPVIYHHHERWDGTGYPMRLKGDQIPLGARIVAVCDAFDAMTTDRPYRKAFPIEHALDEIVKNAGIQFDPVCAALLVEVIERLGDVNLEDRFVRYA
ncbi:MAG: HD domain-containing protein [Actinobacteria bacterium]|nr:HD domain-containing protein [Actinomycetota bacterium]